MRLPPSEITEGGAASFVNEKKENNGVGQPPLTAKVDTVELPAHRRHHRKVMDSVSNIDLERSAPFFWTDQITSFRYNIAVSPFSPSLGLADQLVQNQC